MVKKALIYQLMANLDATIKGKEIQLTHRELSIETGRAESWFNNSFNKYEDLQISTFVRILTVVNNRHKANTEAEINGDFLTNIFSSKVLETANAINALSIENEAHLEDFIQSEKTLFQDLIGYWGIISSKRKLNTSEELVLKEIREILKSYDKTVQEEENEQ